MTEATTPAEDPTPAPADHDTDTASATTEAEPAGTGRGSHREERFRRQLRDEQAARQADNQQAAERITALEQQLTAMRRDHIGATAATFGIKPAALWASGAQVDDLLGEDGVPDADKIRAAVEQARAELGITQKKPLPAGGLKSGTMRPQPPRNSWREAFAPREK